MAVFDALDQTTDKAISKSEEFIRNTEAYYELKLFQVLSISLSMVVKFTLIGALGLIALMLLAVALASGIGNTLENEVLGYVLTAVFFGLLGVLVYANRKRIENKIIKKLSQSFFK